MELSVAVRMIQPRHENFNRRGVRVHFRPSGFDMWNRVGDDGRLGDFRAEYLNAAMVAVPDAVPLFDWKPQKQSYRFVFVAFRDKVDAQNEVRINLRVMRVVFEGVQPARFNRKSFKFQFRQGKQRDFTGFAGCGVVFKLPPGFEKSREIGGKVHFWS